MEQEHQFIDYIEQSIIKNWDKDALTDYKGITLQYKDVARKIAKFHIVLESAGIQPGDKIAVCGRNSAHWGVTFLATITYGAVIVPIRHYRIFQRSHAPLPQYLVERGILFRDASRESGRSHRFHASDGSCIRHGIRFLIWFLCRSAHLLPDTYAVSEDYCAVFCRNKTKSNLLCTFDRRENYQKRYSSESGQQNRKTIA